MSTYDQIVFVDTDADTPNPFSPPNFTTEYSTWIEECFKRASTDSELYGVAQAVAAINNKVGNGMKLSILVAGRFAQEAAEFLADHAPGASLYLIERRIHSRRTADK